MATPARLVPKGPAYPGPGQYDLVDYEGPSSHPGSTAAFLSETRRSPQGGRAPQAGPGPGTETATEVLYYTVQYCTVLY